MSDAPEHPLLCHPASRRPAAAAIGASARLASDGSLILRYDVRANLISGQASSLDHYRETLNAMKVDGMINVARRKGRTQTRDLTIVLASLQKPALNVRFSEHT